jgi:photosynthetic reaction center cytochrome c subunit
MKARTLLLAASVLAGTTLTACEVPPVESRETDFRGTGSVHLANVRSLEARVAASIPPVPLEVPPPTGTRADAIYRNVQVLGDLDISEFTHLMNTITQWVSPDEGCAYCHAAQDFAVDTPYTKVVARQMLQMTRAINSEWQTHVGETGVTCWTCHRGNPVPEDVWSRAVPRGATRGLVGGRGGQNIAARSVNYSSLPYDPFTPFILEAQSARVQSRTETPYENRTSIKQTEWVYGFMVHMSESLGVNCTYCHNSRSFSPWEASSPARATAWHGIQLARAVNLDWITPLEGILPPERKGPMGDALKVNCATCHGGAYKPAYGTRMARLFPSLYERPATAPFTNGEPDPEPGPQDLLEPDRAPELGPEDISPERPGPVERGTTPPR